MAHDSTTDSVTLAIREYARKVAAEAPPLNDDQVARLRRLLTPAPISRKRAA